MRDASPNPVRQPSPPWSAFIECWKHKWLYIIACGGTVLLVSLLTSLFPKKYAAQAMISDETVETDLLLGMDNVSAWLKQMQNHDNEGITDPEVYSQILTSTDFAERMSKVYLKKTQGTYLDHMMASAEPSLLDQIFGEEKKGTDDSKAARDRAVRAIKENIKTNYSARFKTTTIQIEDTDADIAAVLADSALGILYTTLSLQDTKMHAMLKDAWVFRENAKNEYYSAQKAYSDYYDSHYSIVSKIVESKIDALEKERDNAFNAYNKACVQYLRAEALSRKETTPFTILKKPTTPIDPSSPHKTAWVSAWTFIVATLLTWGILVRRSQREKKGAPAKER